MSTYNRLNVTLLSHNHQTDEYMKEIKQKMKEHFNTDNVLIISGFGDKDELIIIDTETNKRLC